MWEFVVLLAVWMTYVEVEMPDRTNECNFDNSCEIEDQQEIKKKGPQPLYFYVITTDLVISHLCVFFRVFKTTIEPFSGFPRT